TASPPAAVISCATASAALASAPSPVRLPPRSFTTTRAPRAASASAWARPRPWAAPVTTATRPSSRSSSLTEHLPVLWFPDGASDYGDAMTSQLTGKRILVTGVTGMVAGPMAARLAADGNTVWGAARFADPTQREAHEANGITTIRVDLEHGELDE